MGDFWIMRKAGPLHNGAERGKGVVFHAVSDATRDEAWKVAVNAVPAICGAVPSLQWASTEGEAAICNKCIRLMTA